MPSLRTFAVLVTTLVSAGCSEDLTLPGGNSGNTPAPASLTAVAGDDQRATVGAVLDQPLTVQALDASAQPVAGVRVEFAFLGAAAGATLDPAATTTDAEGRAATTVRLGPLPGEQTIVAAVADPRVPLLSARFTATATRAHGNGGGNGKDEGD